MTCIVANGGITPASYSSQTSGIWVQIAMTSEAISEYLIFKVFYLPLLLCITHTFTFM